MAKLEKVLVALFAIGLMLRFSRLDGGDVITVLAGMLLGALYLFFGFALLAGVRARHIFTGSAYQKLTALQLLLAAIAGSALGIAAVATVFCALWWQGGSALHFIALAGLIPLLFIVLVLRRTMVPPDRLTGWVIRIVAALVLVLAAPYFPQPSHHLPASSAPPAGQQAGG